MDNEIPQTPPTELKSKKQGFKLERKYILIAALLIVAIAATVVVYFMFVRPPASELDDQAYLENLDGEAIQRTLEGADEQHLYSQNGELLSIEGNSLTFRIETIVRIDDINYANFEEKTGKITDQTVVFRISSDPNDPTSVTVDPITLSGLQISDGIDVRSYQNFLVLEEFNIHEIYLLP